MGHSKRLIVALGLLFSACLFGCNSTEAVPEPTNLTYSQTTASYVVNKTITRNIPSVTGAVIRYSVSPALPLGLSLNDSSGIIGGTPLTTSPSSNYTITAYNNAGSVSIVINISVLDSSPYSLSYTTPVFYALGMYSINIPAVTDTFSHYSVFPALPPGLSLNDTSGVISGTPISAPSVGIYTVTAAKGVDSATGTVSITVYYAPPSNLFYASSNNMYIGGTPIADNVPTITGIVLSYSVSPALPPGLSLNDTTGVISGAPDTTSPSTTYTVTAKNALGSTTATVHIGVPWVLRVAGGGTDLNFVTWAGNQFVAVGVAGAILTSPDGRSWTIRNSGTTDAIFSVTWTGSQMVAVGNAGTILTSMDGVNWTARNSGLDSSLKSVIWAGNQLVAVGNGGTILTSSDAITWKPRVSGTPTFLTSVTWTGGLLVAVGAGNDSNSIVTSADGITWTPRYASNSGNLGSITWTGTQLVGVGFVYVLTSPDGITWSSKQSTTGNNVNNFVTWTNNQLVVVGDQGIFSSPDGIVWTGSGTGYYYEFSVASTGNRLVAVGENGTILTSY